MPEQMNSVAANVQVVSNSLDDFTASAMGPEQAKVRFKSLSYISFDYNGKRSQEPVVAVQAICEPLDGSNDNKDFDIIWTTGAKMSEFGIINDGGALSPIGSRTSLNNNSNWALFLKSIRDAIADFDFGLLNGDKGIGYLSSSELMLKRIAVHRQGLKQEASADSKDKENLQYYTCIRVESLPGQTVAKRAGSTAKKTAAPAASAPASKPTSNGHSHDLIAIVKSILSNGGNTSSLKDLQLSAFRHLKEEGMAVGEGQALARTIDEKFIEDNSMEHGLDISGTGKEAIVTLTA